MNQNKPLKNEAQKLETVMNSDRLSVALFEKLSIQTILLYRPWKCRSLVKVGSSDIQTILIRCWKYWWKLHGFLRKIVIGDTVVAGWLIGSGGHYCRGRTCHIGCAKQITVTTLCRRCIRRGMIFCGIGTISRYPKCWGHIRMRLPIASWTLSWSSKGEVKRNRCQSKQRRTPSAKW